MADNIPVTPGAGVIVATDNINFGGSAAAQAQVIKLFDGTAGSINGLVIDAAGTAQIKIGPVTPRVATVSVITTGGSAVTVITGPINGGQLMNPPTLAAQAIAAAEPLYYDLVGTPGSTDAAANGTTFELAAGGVFIIPPLLTGVTLKANALTSGHKFSVMVW